MVRILIADDQPLERDGLRALLDRADDFDIVGEARDGQEAIQMAEQLAPDVVLMDISMPDIDGLQATKHISSGSPKVVIVTGYIDEFLIDVAIKKGAKGYISKKDMRAELAPAIRGVQQGNIYYSDSVSKFLSNK